MDRKGVDTTSRFSLTSCTKVARRYVRRACVDRPAPRVPLPLQLQFQTSSTHQGRTGQQRYNGSLQKGLWRKECENKIRDKALRRTKWFSDESFLSTKPNSFYLAYYSWNFPAKFIQRLLQEFNTITSNTRRKLVQSQNKLRLLFQRRWRPPSITVYGPWMYFISKQYVASRSITFTTLQLFILIFCQNFLTSGYTIKLQE